MHVPCVRAAQRLRSRLRADCTERTCGDDTRRVEHRSRFESLRSTRRRNSRAAGRVERENSKSRTSDRERDRRARGASRAGWHGA